MSNENEIKPGTKVHVQFTGKVVSREIYMTEFGEKGHRADYANPGWLEVEDEEDVRHLIYLWPGDPAVAVQRKTTVTHWIVLGM